jgi:hypothetical protein
MADKMYKTMKVFDCQNMPEDVKASFFEATEGSDNDCYLFWYWASHANVDKWLVDNGAKRGSEVLISHWW